MVVCGILTLVMVPALLPRRAPRRARRALLMPRLAGWIVRRRRPVLARGVVLTCVLGLAATRLRINPTLDRLRSVTDAARLETQDRIGVRPAERRLRRAGRGRRSSSRCSRRTSGSRGASSAELPGLAFQPPTRLLPSAAAQTRHDRKRSADAGCRASAVRAVARARARGRRLHARRVRSVFGTAAAPARSGRAPHLRRLRGPRPRAT